MVHVRRHLIGNRLNEPLRTASSMSSTIEQGTTRIMAAKKTRAQNPTFLLGARGNHKPGEVAWNIAQWAEVASKSLSSASAP